MIEGKKINNPQTNTIITLPGKKIATIKIVQTIGDTPATEVSLATVTSGSLTDHIASKDFSKLYVTSEEGK
jgi:hypothetical protein